MRRVLLVCLLGLLAAPSVARGDAVLDWSVHAQNTILASGPSEILHSVVARSNLAS